MIIDTETLLFLIKNKILSRFLKENDASISSITLYEYLRMVSLKKEEIDDVFEIVRSLFKIIPVDEEIVRISVKIWREIKMKESDIITAATAISKNIPLCTINDKKYKRLERMGLKVVPLNSKLHISL